MHKQKTVATCTICTHAHNIHKLRPTETKRNNTDNKEEQQSRANDKQGQTETNRDKEGPRETTHTTKKDNGDMCMSQLGCLASKLVGMENIVRSDTLMYP